MISHLTDSHQPRKGVVVIMRKPREAAPVFAHVTSRPPQAFFTRIDGVSRPEPIHKGAHQPESEVGGLMRGVVSAARGEARQMRPSPQARGETCLAAEEREFSRLTSHARGGEGRGRIRRAAAEGSCL